MKQREETRTTDNSGLGQETGSRSGGKPTRFDLLLLLAILLFAGIFWLAVHFLTPAGNTVVVTVDGYTVLTLSLSEDREEVVKTGNGFNTSRIKDGEVSVAEADCPDKLCVRQGWISYDGESIVCLPHKLVVTVRGSGHDLDAVAR